jgi:hypothetical protein
MQIKILTLVSSPYECVETRNIEVFWLLSNPLLHPHFINCDFRTSLREFLDPVLNRFTRQTIPTLNRKHIFMSILCVESFCPQETHNRTLFFGRILFKHGHDFDYWKPPLNMRMRICCLDCHEAGLCCYLVIHMENPLHPLQLFYFNLWPIYWLSLVY